MNARCSASGIGVLLVNLGTPDAPTPAAVKRYLARVPVGPAGGRNPADRLAADIARYNVEYAAEKDRPTPIAQVWTEKGSPLAAITAEQAEMLQARLGDAAHRPLGDALRQSGDRAGACRRSSDAGCERILLAPLYPQYAAATNASVVDKLGEALRSNALATGVAHAAALLRRSAYIGALAKDLGASSLRCAFAPEVLLLSFHGLPQRSG